MHYRRWLFSLVLAFFLVGCASAQSVLSVRSGVVHFFEGSVYIDDQPLEPVFGTFPMIKEGSRLWTGDDGRVEVLLTPGVFLRLVENSSIRMVTNSLADTRVEFVRGSMILDSGDATAGNSVVVTYKDWQIRFPEHGVYRIDCDPAAVLQVYSGQAQLTQGGKPATVDPSHLFFFAAGTSTKKYDDGADDDFYHWAEDRSEAIAKDNELSAQTSRDPADLDNDQALPAVPGLGLGAPSYGAPLGTLPLNGGGLIYPYSAFGGPIGIYSVFPLYVPRYYGSIYARPVVGLWPNGTTRAAGTVWPIRTGYRHWPSTSTGISRPPIFIHPIPVGAGVVRSGAVRPAYAHPMPVPHAAAPAAGAVHPVIHR